MRIILGDEVHRDGIDTMAGILGGEAFAFEDVAQMAAAVGTDDLDTPAVGVQDACYGSFYLVIKAGPAAERVELVIGPIQGGVALFAGVEAGSVMHVVLASERTLCAFVDKDTFFFGG